MEIQKLKRIIRISSLLWFTFFGAVICFITSLILLAHVFTDDKKPRDNSIALGIGGLFPYLWIPNIIDYLTNSEDFEDRVIDYGRKLDKKIDDIQKKEKGDK